jgi:hypothetical protein
MDKRGKRRLIYGWQFERDFDRQASVDTPACASGFVIFVSK